MKKAIILIVLASVGLLFAVEPNSVDFPEKFDYPTLYDSDDVTDFYPVGWSEDGKFAYLRYDDFDDGLGEKVDFYFAIQDMVSDEILWEKSLFEEQMTRLPEQLWAYDTEIEDKLEEYGIISDDYRFEAFPFTMNGKTYEVDLMWEEYNDIRYSLSYYQVDVWTGARHKLIATGVETYAVELTAIGAFISPYEDRMAVAVQEYSQSYEGPPYEVEIVVYGCHMADGFERGWR